MFPTTYMVILFLSFTYSTADSINFEAPNIATYIWHTSTIDRHTDEYIDFATHNNITDIYLQYKRDINIITYRNFIVSAHNADIDVHLLHGAPEWVYSQNEILLSNMLNWLDSYQKNAPAEALFAGIHLDIEYYLLDLNEKETKDAIAQYQQRILFTKDFCEKNDIKLSTSIPFWFDKIKLSKKSDYNNLAEWNISTVDDTVLMAYRNSIFGSNAILNIIEDELLYASDNNAQIIIALETRESNEGDHLSFYGLDHSILNHFMAFINLVLQNEPSFNGFAIHHLETWIQLKSPKYPY